MQEIYLFYFILFLGFLICAAGIHLIRKSPIYQKGTKHTEGVIEGSVCLTQNLYNPKISFKAVDRQIVFVSSYTTNKKPVVGKAVKVIYNPAAPENAEMKSLFSVALPALIAALGFCIIAVCGAKIIVLLLS